MGATSVAFTAVKARALTPSGAVAAAVVGSLVLTNGSSRSAIALLAFFMTGSGLSQINRRESANQGQIVEKRSRRDAWQVLANGGIAATLAALFGQRRSEIVEQAILGSLSASTADTWATEIGAHSPEPPRDIVRGTPVLPGASGGVTAMGLAGSLLGAAMIAVIGFWDRSQDSPRMPVQRALGILLAGIAGSLADSVAGSMVQALYRCEECNQVTEQVTHECGQPATLIRGQRWINNDVVNLCATIVGAVVAALWESAFHGDHARKGQSSRERSTSCPETRATIHAHRAPDVPAVSPR
ncbi:MAG: DUF92 domain-containing protein [Chloroflexi bacterium]|nr:DUF92 domain-containing protein [Chloroflexota bacterium]